MLQANQRVGKIGDLLEEQYGFVADESKPFWQNVDHAMGCMSIHEYLSRPSNLQCHNYLHQHPFPSGARELLGLGLNYTIIPKRMKTNEHTFSRLRNDIRRTYFHTIQPPMDTPNRYGPSYIPSLYIKSEIDWKPASKDIEEAMNNFEASVKSAQREHYRRHPSKPNLTQAQRSLLELLRRHDKYIVVEADKNLGPCILDRTTYIRRGCSEHLGNTSNYKIISRRRATTTMRHLEIQFNDWLTKYYWNQYQARQAQEVNDGPPGITDAEGEYLCAAQDHDLQKLARFRMTLKIHKTPWKTRPIVCCAGTWMNCWSKWLDYQLQRLKPFVSTFLRDAQQVLDDTRDLVLPANARITSADATAMYNNIDTEHAIEVIGLWLDELAPLVGADFPVEAIKDAMTIIMRNNIFEWGVLRFLQLLGTAMGTSAAVMWATIYFGYHEAKTLIPKYGDHFLYFKRYIDDIFLIWLVDDSSAWDDFQADLNNFGILKWEVNALGKSVDFLDLTLSIVGDKLESRTFQKKMNLYLYLPPSSAHSPSIIKGTIFGMINRYYAHNTHRRDYISFVKLLYTRLLNRGWKKEVIMPIFLDAAERVESRPKHSVLQQQQQQQDRSKDGPPDDTVFVHVQYHPFDIPRRQYRQLFEEHLGSICRDTLGKERPVIAYSRLPNIGEYVTQAKLHEAPGETSDIIMGEYRDGLDPS